jgi:serine/threonine-protein kinase
LKNGALQLSQGWAIGSQIGRGGFGRVFEAVGDDGRIAAVKLIPKAPGADRELLFEDLAGVRHIVPIIDSGEDDGNWVIVMPRAVESLRSHLTERKTLSPEETIAIMTDVLMALADLHGRVIHRDIKPENVLLLDGHWCLSDFGIARYAEASTSADTHKWAWTQPYNPPERWRGERATAASDIYSLGVMAFEMLAGHWPFTGPDFRSQHLNEDVPPLTGSPALLAALVSEFLFKAADVRPRAANALARLGLILRPTSAAAGQLQAANRQEVERFASQAAERSAARSAAERHDEIVASATKLLVIIGERLAQAIRDNAPAALWQPAARNSGWSFRLGEAVLSFDPVQRAGNAWPSGWRPVFEVIATSDISIRIPPDRFGYEGRSHSLYFCDAQECNVFRWYETAFMISPLIPRRAKQNPFSLSVGEQAGKALANAMTEYQLAWPFTVIEPGNDEEFIERWMSWFAQAAQGRLVHPQGMPERLTQGSFRHK